MSYHKIDSDIPREENDFYATPVNVARTFSMQVMRTYFTATRRWQREDQELRILDVGPGTGVWGAVWSDFLYFHLPKGNYLIDGVEIDPEFPHHPCYTNWYNKDFLTWENEDKYDIIIGNPPFGIINGIVQKYSEQLNSNGVAAFIAPNMFMNSATRYDLFYDDTPLRDFYLDEVLVPARRINYRGKGNNNPRQEHYYIFWKSAYSINFSTCITKFVKDWVTEDEWRDFLKRVDSLNLR